jgi:transcriptional regulator NrdR family protein
MSIDLKKYLNNPNSCPYCGSEEVQGGRFEPSDNKAWRNVRCLSCEKRWTEEFTITKITEDEV